MVSFPHKVESVIDQTDHFVLFQHTHQGQFQPVCHTMYVYQFGIVLPQLSNYTIGLPQVHICTICTESNKLLLPVFQAKLNHWSSNTVYNSVCMSMGHLWQTHKRVDRLAVPHVSDVRSLTFRVGGIRCAISHNGNEMTLFHFTRLTVLQIFGDHWHQLCTSHIIVICRTNVKAILFLEQDERFHSCERHLFFCNAVGCVDFHLCFVDICSCLVSWASNVLGIVLVPTSMLPSTLSRHFTCRLLLPCAVRFSRLKLREPVTKSFLPVSCGRSTQNLHVILSSSPSYSSQSKSFSQCGWNFRSFGNFRFRWHCDSLGLQSVFRDSVWEDVPGTSSSSTDSETARSSLPSSLVFALLVFVLSLEKNELSFDWELPARFILLWQATSEACAPSGVFVDAWKLTLKMIGYRSWDRTPFSSVG